MYIRLSPRLQAIAELVRPGARVIDVGTDHAMVPVWLAQTGRAAHVWAADLRSGPLESAAAIIRETGVCSVVELRQTDGLCGFSADDGDTIIIAGMGGETMASILSAAPWLKQGASLILQPQSKQALLRRWLTGNGFHIDGERLVRDAGRIYSILTAVPGSAASYTECECHTGLFSQLSGEELFPAFLKQLKDRTAKAAPYDEEARALLIELGKMEERLR